MYLYCLGFYHVLISYSIQQVICDITVGLAVVTNTPRHIIASNNSLYLVYIIVLSRDSRLVVAVVCVNHLGAQAARVCLFSKCDISGFQGSHGYHNTISQRQKEHGGGLCRPDLEVSYII